MVFSIHTWSVLTATALLVAQASAQLQDSVIPGFSYSGCYVLVGQAIGLQTTLNPNTPRTCQTNCQTNNFIYAAVSGG